jgi:hypothetical protein
MERRGRCGEERGGEGRRGEERRPEERRGEERTRSLTHTAYTQRSSYCLRGEQPGKGKRTPRDSKMRTKVQ